MNYELEIKKLNEKIATLEVEVQRLQKENPQDVDLLFEGVCTYP